VVTVARLQSPERLQITTLSVMAFELKAKGNELYKNGDYQGAEELYTQA
jgi:hypothetical protein